METNKLPEFYPQQNSCFCPVRRIWVHGWGGWGAYFPPRLYAFSMGTLSSSHNQKTCTFKPNVDCKALQWDGHVTCSILPSLTSQENFILFNTDIVTTVQAVNQV